MNAPTLLPFLKPSSLVKISQGSSWAEFNARIHASIVSDSLSTGLLGWCHGAPLEVPHEPLRRERGGSHTHTPFFLVMRACVGTESDRLTGPPVNILTITSLVIKVHFFDE